MKTINRFKKNCITTTFAILMATSISFGMDNSEQDVTLPRTIFGLQSRDKTTQKFIPQNLKTIKILREFHQQYGEKSLVEHHDVLIPFAEYLLETMNSGLQNKYTEKLKKEVNRNLEDREVSATWLLGIHVRYISLLGEPTPAEIELFDHTPSEPGYFKALLKKDIHGNPSVLNIYKISSLLDKADNGDRVIKKIFVPELYDKARKQINHELKKTLPLPILYPLLGEGILHPRFIINCLLDEIYPIGAPTGSVPSVHGENATPISFTYHDYFHHKIDTRRQVLKTYIQFEVAEAIKNGMWASDFIPHLVPLAVQKYNLFMDALKFANVSLGEDKHGFSGLFFMMHEFPSFSVDLFKKSNPSEIFETMLKGSLSEFNEDESWHNPTDILRTNPLDGMAFSTDKEIKEAAVERALKDSTLVDYAPYPYDIYNKVDGKGNIEGRITGDQEVQQARKNWLLKNSRIELKKSAQFIDAIIQFTNSQEKTYTFPTLYRKWRNFEASSGMLKFAGIQLVQPQLTTNVIENREIAINFIEQVNGKIKGTMEDFLAKAKVFLGEGSGSYSEIYANKFSDIESKISKIKETKKQ